MIFMLFYILLDLSQTAFALQNLKFSTSSLNMFPNADLCLLISILLNVNKSA